MNGRKRNFERFGSRDEAITYWNRNSKKPFPALACTMCDGKQYFDILDWLFDECPESGANDGK